MKSFWRSVSLAGLLLLGLAPTAAADPSLARLSFSSGWDALPALIGIERGFFAENGLVVSGLAVNSADTILKSVTIGSSDFAAVPQRALLLTAASKLPVKVISMNGWGTPMDLIAPAQDQTIKSVADLKGKTIAMTTASEAYPVLIRLLNTAKLRPSDVKIKLVSSNQLTKAFDGHLADAVFETRYFTVVLLQNKKGRVVMTGADVVKALGLIQGTALLVRNDLITKDPALVQKFVNGWVKALKYIQQHPDDAADVMQIFFHRQGVVVAKPLAKAWVMDTRYDRYRWTPADVADAEYNGWGLQQGQVLKIAPKIGGMVDNQFADAAVRNLK
jgi:ABC-type nitrate/sulfonate/bicarbonate transport system substrate-binding protein